MANARATRSSIPIPAKSLPTQASLPTQIFKCGGAEGRTAARWSAAPLSQRSARSCDPARNAAWNFQALRHGGVRSDPAPVVPARLRPQAAAPQRARRRWARLAFLTSGRGDSVKPVRRASLPRTVSEKGLALVQTAGAGGGGRNHTHLRRHGLVYALGILLSSGDCGRAADAARHGQPRGMGIPVAVTSLHRTACGADFSARALAGGTVRDWPLSLTSAGSSLVDRAASQTIQEKGSRATRAASSPECWLISWWRPHAPCR